MAWGVLSDEACRTVLHTTAARIYHVLTTAMEGVVRNAQVGNSVNASNALMATLLLWDKILPVLLMLAGLI